MSTKGLSRAPNSLVFRKLGLAAGLKLCLDAGDSSSLPAASAKWFDTSGNGNHFTLGDRDIADANDPAITGTAGRLSAGEYLEFNNDNLTYPGTATWIDNLHKAGTKGGVAIWAYMTATASRRFGGTRTGSTNNGWMFSGNSTGYLTMTVSNGSANVFASAMTSLAMPLNGWALFWAAFDYGAGDLVLGLNGVGEQKAIPTSGYGTGAATNTFKIGRTATSSSDSLFAGTRIASWAMWEGARPGPEQMLAYFDASRFRFGV